MMSDFLSLVRAVMFGSCYLRVCRHHPCACTHEARLQLRVPLPAPKSSSRREGAVPGSHLPPASCRGIRCVLANPFSGGTCVRVETESMHRSPIAMEHALWEL